jgi:uncharacterized Ntn-hydrolase superfamily protein
MDKQIPEAVAHHAVLWQVLQAEVRAHQRQVHQVLDSGRNLAASGHPEAQCLTEQCQKLEGQWAELEQACAAQTHCLQRAATFQQVGCRQRRVSRVAEVWQALGGFVGPSGR